MTLTLLTGRSGTGKSTRLFEYIQNTLAEDMERQCWLLVPEQMTFQAERNLVRAGGGAVTRANVFSFTSLAYQLLDETGGLTERQLGVNGIHALLRRLMHEHEDELQLFHSSRRKSGFVTKLEQFLSECKRYQADCGKMQQVYRHAAEEITDPRLEAKLHDIELMQRKTEEALHGSYVESEDLLRLLQTAVQESGRISSVDIFIDGFHTFSPSEHLVLQLLLEKTNVTAAFTTGGSVKGGTRAAGPMDVFFEPERHALRLADYAEQAGVTVKEEHGTVPFRFENFPAAAHLEAAFEQMKPDPAEEQERVYRWEAVNQRTEIEHIAREIHHLIREHGYRYRETAVVVRSLEQYRDFIDMVFTREQLPHFLDQQRPALDHPLAELLLSSLEAERKSWPFEAVFRAVKTGFFYPEEDQRYVDAGDRLENRALEFGVRGNRWWDGGWQDQLDEDELNLLSVVTAAFSQLHKDLKAAATLKDGAAALYRYLERLDAGSVLERRALAHEQSGRTDKALEHEQVWKEVISLLDDIVEVSGNTPFEKTVFQDMISAGLESMTYSIIPPAFDQVIIADAETSRIPEVRALFLIGINEGIFPQQPDEEGLLEEGERQLLMEGGMELAPGAEEQLAGEKFLFYRALTHASERLYLSYALESSDGSALQPSLFLDWVVERLPDVSLEEKYAALPEHDPEDQKKAVTNEKMAFTHLTLQLKRAEKGYAVPDFWWGLYNQLLQHGSRSRMEQMIRAVQYKNVPESLSTETAASLYGKKFRASVSRFESFQACPFSQYAKYGLQLQERKIRRLEAPDIGILFHDALKDVTNEVRRRGRRFKEMEDPELRTLTHDVTEKLKPQIQRNLMSESHKYEYIFEKLQQVVTKAAFMMAEQDRRQQFVPVGLEVGFGPGMELPPLEIKLDDGTLVDVVGRIDRVDQADTAGGMFLRIVDYKSSSRDLRLDEIYYGLAMQMLVYLDILLENAASWLHVEADAAGMLYFHVHNPMLRQTERVSEEEIEKEMLKQFKMKGLISGDPEVLAASDTSIESGWSDIVPLNIKKDGTPSSAKGSNAVEPEILERMRQFIRTFMKSTAEGIAGGSTALEPYRKKGRTPCMFCSYRAFCQFDPDLETNNYRKLEDIEDKEMIEKWKEEHAIDEQTGRKPMD
ncbi:helicase-exonuclease AddAB subunit AddB [Alkalicoccus chagannorensis]|uniref:helicase-exonuclease AddAB subunit AddB n=1 Tax=Alkalicoccus chagannorensis TaxID=427072 RepID=UPI000416C83F|nr:helicase-exonuclease AddAB subunit AddB [Alkalicoccus chagannorensis]